MIADAKIMAARLIAQLDLSYTVSSCRRSSEVVISDVRGEL